MKLDPSLIPINVYSIFILSSKSTNWTSKMIERIIKYFFFIFHTEIN